MIFVSAASISAIVWAPRVPPQNLREQPMFNLIIVFLTIILNLFGVFRIQLD